jgi:leader peptidase (prepilin peptidase) / N-methyltransferase
MLLTQKSRKAQQWGKKIPFGPFLALGSLINLFIGEALISSYLELFPK